MKGEFGVFDGTELLAQFGTDVDAEEYRADVLELSVAESFRCSPYDDLQVREIPGNYDLLHRLLVGLRRVRNQELAVMRCLKVLHEAQRERTEKCDATARV